MIKQQILRIIVGMSYVVIVLVVVLGRVEAEAAQEGSLQEAQTLNQHVENLYSLGRYQDAIPLAERALATHERGLGPDHPDTATSLNNLAALYQATGAYAQAEPLYQRALTIREKILGPDHPNTSISLSNLAALYLARGAYAQAEPLLQRALAIHEQGLGPDHPDTAQSLDNLATLRLAAGDAVSALPLLERAQAIDEKNARGFLLSGSEARKLAYLQQSLGSIFANITFSLSVQPPYQCTRTDERATD